MALDPSIQSKVEQLASQLASSIDSSSNIDSVVEQVSRKLKERLTSIVNNESHVGNESDLSNGGSVNEGKSKSSLFSLRKLRLGPRSPGSQMLRSQVLQETPVSVCVTEAMADSDFHSCTLKLVSMAKTNLLVFLERNRDIYSCLVCALITEARLTTDLEADQKPEATIVLRSGPFLELIVKMSGKEEAEQWLKVIRQSITLPNTTNINKSSNFTTQNNKGSTSNKGLMEVLSRKVDEQVCKLRRNQNEPNLPENHTIRCVTPNMMSNENHNEIDENRNIFTIDDRQRQLSQYPWYHGTLSRHDAARLVLFPILSSSLSICPRTGRPELRPASSAENNAGCMFVVRQSESRRAEFVLTLAHRARAKHVRITFNDEGQCEVSGLWFNSIFECLEHFRRHALPSEPLNASSTSCAEVFLDAFVVCIGNRAVFSDSDFVFDHHDNHQEADQGHAGQRPLVLTFGGSVRTSSRTLELLMEADDGSGWQGNRNRGNAYVLM